ncbi:MAG: HlyD family efflux transporter periplasmic adaptor subunit [Verrucomicrobia bacterium]|nr:HlyD family efflux transporter periplasmic adaptor subunit [Verrucomicrobiota bacterium]
MLKFISRTPLWLKTVTLILVAAALYAVFGRGKIAISGTTFTARRGPLEINVLVGGSLEALESQDIKCEVRGYQGVKILKIVEEGYQVTEDDVKNGKLLVELDSSELKKQINQQDIQFQGTVASLKEAEESYEIQLNQNLSDVKAAEQKAKFARMDFDKFMGASVGQEIIDQLDLAAETNPTFTNKLEKTVPPVLGNTNAPPVEKTPVTIQFTDGAPPVVLSSSSGVFPSKPASNDSVPARTITPPSLPTDPVGKKAAASASASFTNKLNIDFMKYAKVEQLGDGEAKQKIRKVEDDFQQAQKSLGISKSKFEGTKRLFDKGFVTKNDLETDQYNLESDQIKAETAETARTLFLKYEFPKSAEESLSKYIEAARELERSRKGAISKLAQAEAKMKSAQGRYELEVRQMKELTDQVDKCVIKAKKTGLVVYGGGNMNYYWYGQEPIREGSLVREQQPIITIPDMTRMAVKVRVHETYIKKISKGQKVRITVDAVPDKKLSGEVTKVAVLPDSQGRWMNPDLKEYLTTIDIMGVHDWLKPGMSAKVEILVKNLSDVVYVPIQSVTPEDGKQYCYVAKGTGQQRRELEIGEFNDEFIEVKKGLTEGEKVYLHSPEAKEKEVSDKTPAAQPKAAAATPAAKATPEKK